MAVDMFLKLDGIDGESQDSVHKGEIDIFSYSWGVSNAGSLASGGSGAGKASFQDLHFESGLSKASPNLMLACATGKHIPSAVLTVRKAGGSQAIEFLKIKLADVLVSSYDNAGSRDGDRPEDAFSLFFAKIDVEYTAQNADGSSGEVVEATFDLSSLRQ
jgi:type VI secretion system secreted protein Hcp